MRNQILAILHHVAKIPSAVSKVNRRYASVYKASSVILMVTNVDQSVPLARIALRTRLALTTSALILAREFAVIAQSVKLLITIPSAAALRLWWAIPLRNAMKLLNNWNHLIHVIPRHAVQMACAVFSMVLPLVPIRNVWSMMTVRAIALVSTRNAVILASMPVASMQFAPASITRPFVPAQLDSMVLHIIVVCNKWKWYPYLNQNVSQIVTAATTKLASINNVRTLANWITSVDKTIAVTCNYIDLCASVTRVTQEML